MFREVNINVLSIKETFEKENLSQAKALIISGPFKPLSEKEIDVLKDYVKEGGGLFVMLHISSPAQKLFETFGVEITKGAISEKENFLNKKQIFMFPI